MAARDVTVPVASAIGISTAPAAATSPVALSTWMRRVPEFLSASRPHTIRESAAVIFTTVNPMAAWVADKPPDSAAGM